MTTITAETIVRGLCAELGYELLDFRRGETYIGITVCDPDWGVPIAYGFGNSGGEPLVLGDDALDTLREMLTGEAW